MKKMLLFLLATFLLTGILTACKDTVADLDAPEPREIQEPTPAAMYVPAQTPRLYVNFSIEGSPTQHFRATILYNLQCKKLREAQQ